MIENDVYFWSEEWSGGNIQYATCDAWWRSLVVILAKTEEACMDSTRLWRALRDSGATREATQDFLHNRRRQNQRKPPGSRTESRAPQPSEITGGDQMIIGHYSSPSRLGSARHLAPVVMLMRGFPSPSLPAPCLTFMGLKSSEWWSASVWDSKLHRFNWEESSPWVCWAVPVGWPWTEQHVVHPYKKKKGREKYGRTFLFMMQRLICLRPSHINLPSLRFAK